MLACCNDVAFSLSSDNARGKKIVRLVRRVSGLLMNITVFEIPQQVVDAAQAAKGIVTSAPTAPTNTTATEGAVQPTATEGAMQPDAQSAASPVVDGGSAAAASGEGATTVATATPMVADSTEQLQAVGDVTTAPPASENTTTGFAEQRSQLHTLQRWPVPAFRIVAYDPRSRRKVSVCCVFAAI